MPGCGYVLVSKPQRRAARVLLGHRAASAGGNNDSDDLVPAYCIRRHVRRIDRVLELESLMYVGPLLSFPRIESKLSCNRKLSAGPPSLCL